MKTTTTLQTCLACLICFWLTMFTFYEQANAQISTVNGYNYYDINHDAFTVDASCLTTSQQKERELGYYFTSIQLANSVEDIFNHSNDSVDFVTGDYRIQKRSYLNKQLGNETYHWIMVRPDDTVRRPCILVTHGGSDGNPDPLKILSLGICDYVQRGYAVVFYQSGPRRSTSSVDVLQALVDAGFTSACQNVGSPDQDIECLQQAVYLKYQFAIAALDFAAANSQVFFIDTSLFFGAGFSGGAVGTLHAALSDGTDYSDPIFSSMGDTDEISKFQGTSYRLRAISTLAGGLIDASSQNYKFGPVVDPGDTTTRILMFHGQDDFAIQPEVAPLQWADPNIELPGSQMRGTLALAETFEQYDIPHKSIINCSACHSLFTWPCDYNDDCLGNNPLFELGFCLLWADTGNFSQIDFNNLCASGNDDTYWTEMFYVMSQIHDYAKIGAHYFHKSFPDTGPATQPNPFINTLLTNSQPSAINPTSFPFDAMAQETNGHFKISTKCLQQTNSGLYFNRIGGSNILGLNYKGDYLTLPAFSGSNVFNDDFTLEMHIKPIDHEGPGVLFSLLDNLTFGFEILILNNGNLQFKRNAIIGQGSITGNTQVTNDTCHRVVLTREGNEFALYLDGQLQNTKKSFNVSFPNVSQYRIGNSKNELGPNRGFNGIFRNMRIWDKAISPSLFGQKDLSPSTINLLADWPMIQGFSQEVSSTNQQHILQLGSSITNSNADPRWMKNDELCACDSDPIINSLSDPIHTQPTILVYPNPSQGRITVERKSSTEHPVELHIFDATGRLVLRTTLSRKTQEINLPNKGLYFFGLQEKSSRSFVKVVVY